MRTPNPLDPWDGVKHWYCEEASLPERLGCCLIVLALVVIAVNRVTYEPEIKLTKPYQIWEESGLDPSPLDTKPDKILTPSKYKTYVEHTRPRSTHLKIHNVKKLPGKKFN